MDYEFTKDAEEALTEARLISKRSNSSYIGTHHILLGLYSAQTVAAEILRENGLLRETVAESCRVEFNIEDDMYIENSGDYTESATEMLEIADDMRRRLSLDKIGSIQLLLAMFQKNNCMAWKIISLSGVDQKSVYVDALTAAGVSRPVAEREYGNLKAAASRRVKGKGDRKTPILDKYGKDLVRAAKNGEIDPVIGREDEIGRVLQILCRRVKNNACLVGEPGVGKTAVVEGIARHIADKTVPTLLLDKRIVMLDLSAMVAGTKYRGEFEERMKKALDELKAGDDIILFLDEIHTIVGAGAAEGTMDAANIMKPALSRGEIQVIGATTRNEYRKRIEKDAALARRFQPVYVEEPTEEETMDILRGIAPEYESFHEVKIPEDVMQAAVDYSVRYINDRYLPDKAIDLIDEAAAKKRLAGGKTKVQTDYDVLKKRKEKEIEDALSAGNIDEASELKEELSEIMNRKKLDEKLDKLRSDSNDYEALTELDIAQAVSVWTRIPVYKITESEQERLSNLEEILHGRVIGQDDAVSAVSRAIRRGRVGLKDPKRPIGSFLFLGPTGVGKTELSKALAEALFGDEKKLIRVDMSEYMEKHTVSKFIGSPPGYVGYEEGGQLAESVRKNPYSVILFDEIEKAHPDVFNILLQVLDDGMITDSQGRKCDFKNTIIIMTSNAGARRIVDPKPLGFVTGQDDIEADYQKMKESVMEEVENIFRPEFINRIDEIMVFRTLTRENIYDITALLFEDLSKRAMKNLGIKLTLSQAAREYIFEKGYDKKLGARPLKRTIQTEIEDKLSKEILDGNIKKGDHVTVDHGEDGIIFVTASKQESDDITS